MPYYMLDTICKTVKLSEEEEIYFPRQRSYNDL